MVWTLNGVPEATYVTSELANNFANMEAAHTDRPLSDRRLEVYQRYLESGEFRPVVWAKAFCKETKKFYRVNGKHTSTLFSQLDLPRIPPLLAIVEEYVCDTLADVARLYNTYDSTVQGRSSGDINKAVSACIPSLDEVDGKFINLAVAALAFAEDPTTQGRFVGSSEDSTRHALTAPERAEVLNEHTDEVLWLYKLTGNKLKGSLLHRVPVAAAIVTTKRVDENAALEFWTAVRDRSGPSPDCQDRVLGEFLMTSKLKSDGNHSREFYCRCLSHWNYWRKGEKKVVRYLMDSPIPQVV
ncbi:unnamed protein product [Gemmata massiliana]|uniref:Uncharacterized protein n=1 Tax=Gemmata massiliana TaxID=1210884 RepID=A0A6P2CUT9_9BACT|nr:hypothetical protein [Gemmata massiliana]VTR92126.1 unnamed protein product [Gemmata massiliana]